MAIVHTWTVSLLLYPLGGSEKNEHWNCMNNARFGKSGHIYVSYPWYVFCQDFMRKRYQQQLMQGKLQADILRPCVIDKTS